MPGGADKHENAFAPLLLSAFALKAIGGQPDLVWLRAGDGLAVLRSSRQRSARPRHVITRDPVDPLCLFSANLTTSIPVEPQ